MSDEAFRMVMLYVTLPVLVLGALLCFLGIFVLITHRVPIWLPSRARQAQWKPYGWSQIFTFTWVTTMFLPQALSVDPLLRLGLMVPAVGFMIISWVFLFKARRPEEVEASPIS
ncbi:hypothetical protein ACFHYQ_19910 [Sphaerimonospora cavernae]|uniref:Uncharacterized protein n=1 Tax=Sphaerimonospora cavernae TaxID=1740611 RepID=A0ABV6U7X9_9ACTN